MSILMIFSAIVALYVLIMAGVALLMSRKSGWIMALVRLGLTLVAALLAIPLAQALAGLLADMGLDMLMPVLGQDIADVLAELPAGAEGLRVIASLLMAPVLYFLIFLLLRGLLTIVAFLLGREIPKLKERTIPAAAMSIGAFNGLLIAFVTLIPLCGYLALGATVIHTAVDAGLTDTQIVQDMPAGIGNDAEAIADELDNNPAIAMVHQTLGRPIFKGLTTGKLDATETHGVVIQMTLETELCSLLRTGSYAVETAEALQKTDYTAEDKENLMAMADSLLDSTWVKMVATDALVAMAEKWQAGESFAGMARPNVDSEVASVFDCLLELIAVETYATIDEDLHILMDVMGDFLVHDLLKEAGDYGEMLRRISTSGLLNEALIKLEANERTAILAGELKGLGLSLVTNMLGVEELKSGKHEALMENVASTLNDVKDMPREERDAVVGTAIKTAFEEKDFDMPEDVAVAMANEVIDALVAEGGEITRDRLVDYLVNHVDELGGTVPSLPSGDPSEDPAETNEDEQATLPAELPESLPSGWEESIPEDVLDKLP